jgi:HSP20 family protein
MDPRSAGSPWTEMRRLQHQMEHLFSGLSPSLRRPLTGEYPPITVSRSDDVMIVDAACPGIERDKLEVTVVGESVSIRGERKPEADSGTARYHWRERVTGTFARTIVLDERLDADRTEATYLHGILHLRLARAQEAAPKKIAVAS